MTTDQLSRIYHHATAAHIALYHPHLVQRMAAREINTLLRHCHFLAQVGHESGELRYTEELASGEAYEGRTDLGNTQPGDGKRFKGRGLIQLTGRANYAAYGRAIGVDLTKDGAWALVARDPHFAVDVACWFWETHRLNQWADQDDQRTVTRRINGGLSGFADRQRLLTLAKQVLLPSQDTTP